MSSSKVRVMLLSAFIALIVAPLYAQTPVALAPVGRQQFLYSTGDPLAGGCVSTFAAGTSTPLATYTDVTGAIQNANPITLDAGGFATIYLSNAEYKIQVNAAPSSGSCSPSNLGPQQWVQDNVSAYQIINGISNLFFSGVTSDPSGSAGEVVYRSDLPCFRGFTTIWDCFVQTQLSQTLTNKTIDPSANTIPGGTTGNFLRDNGIRFVSSAIQQQDVTAYSSTGITNNSGGTTANGLVKLVTNAGVSQFIGTTTSDTGGAVGICVSGCGTTGTPVVVTSGTGINCQFDGSTIAGDYILISNTTDSGAPVATDCRDTGSATYPSTAGQIIGKVLKSGAGAPIEPIILFPPDIEAAGNLPATLSYGTPSSPTTASIGAVVMTTASASGNTYFFSALAVQTAAGASCTGNSAVQLFANYTDSVTGTAVSISLGSVALAVGNGSIGNNVPYVGSPINAKASTSVSYSTTYTPGSGCSPNPQYYIMPILERLK